MSPEFKAIHLPIPAENLDRSYLETELNIPQFEYDPNNPTRRLLFHFSPKSQIKMRGDRPMIPRGVMVQKEEAISFISSAEGTISFDWRKDLPKEADGPYSFFFLDEPFPDNWVNLYPGYFEYCMAFVRKGRQEPLEIFAVVTDENDKVSVAERLLKAQKEWSRSSPIPDFESALSYIGSLTPLKDYRNDYALPEAAVSSHIDVERLIHVGEVTIPEIPQGMRYWLEPRGSARNCMDR